MQQKQAMQYQNQYKPPPIYVPVRRKEDGVGKKEASSRKVIHLQQRNNLYPDHCMMWSVIMTVKGVKEADGVKPMLERGEYEGCPVSYIGGLKFIVVFKDKRTALEFMAREELWGVVFNSVVLWEGQMLDFDRLAWAKIMDVLIQM
ncbi:hypothetical protein Hanom_Chr07g00588701 [Helianthus anomalus]